MRHLVFALLALALCAVVACGKAASLPDDLPFKDAILPKGAQVLSADKTVIEAGAPGQPTETRWTVQFRSSQPWAEVGVHFTEVLNIQNGLLAVAPEPISGINSDVFTFYNSDHSLKVSLAELASKDAASRKAGTTDYEMVVVQTALRP